MLERKKLKSRSPRITEFFFMRYRRTYVLNNFVKNKILTASNFPDGALLAGDPQVAGSSIKDNL